MKKHLDIARPSKAPEPKPSQPVPVISRPSDPTPPPTPSEPVDMRHNHETPSARQGGFPLVNVILALLIIILVIVFAYLYFTQQ